MMRTKSNDHRNANKNHILTPWDGKALQFGSLGGLTGFLNTFCPRKVVAGKRVSRCNVNVFIVFGNWMGAGASRRRPSVWNHGKEIGIATTYGFHATTFLGQGCAVNS